MKCFVAILFCLEMPDLKFKIKNFLFKHKKLIILSSVYVFLISLMISLIFGSKTSKLLFTIKIF